MKFLSYQDKQLYDDKYAHLQNNSSKSINFLNQKKTEINKKLQIDNRF